MDKESSKMEPRSQHQVPNKQTSGETEKQINEFLKPDENESTKGNKMKNNDTWIKVTKNRARWKQWKVNIQRQQQQYLLTVQHTGKTLRKIQSEQHAT